MFATVPTAGSVLNDHDDWLYGLVAHEYAHVLHLDTVGDLPVWYNRIFGKTWMPNQVQPRWFIEGLATYEESKRSSGGRTRSAIFDMILRCAVLASRTLDLSAVSSGPRAYPHGNAAYLYGAHFLKYVADRFGDTAIANISHTYGSQAIPWNMGRAFRRATGHNLDELYRDWQDHLRQRYTLQKTAVQRRGLREGRRLTQTGEGNAAPHYPASSDQRRRQRRRACQARHPRPSVPMHYRCHRAQACQVRLAPSPRRGWATRSRVLPG